MFLAGWGVSFNLWMLMTRRSSQAFSVGYDDEGPWRAMSPKLATAILSLFWLTGMIMIIAVPRGGA